MASEEIRASDLACLEPPAGHRYVRSFLFSRRINAPFARVHPIARVIMIICLSAAQLRTITTEQTDLAGAILLWMLSFGIFLLSGISVRVARLYFLLTLPALCSLFLTWTIFNPLPGSIVLLRLPVYSGLVELGFSWWFLLWLLLVGGYFLWRRGLFVGILTATVLTFFLSHLFTLSGWTLVHFTYFHPLTILVSDRTLLIAGTKVIGYAGMVLGTIALVITSRDIELIGALRQLRLPNAVIFFLSTVFRALNLALVDYGTIRQAQIVRALNARPRTFIRRLFDTASIAVPMVAVMIRRSGEIGDALLARGFTLQQSQAEFFEARPWRWLDWLVLTGSLMLILFALLSHPTLSAVLQRWW